MGFFRMKQAKVLTVVERKRLLAIIANDRPSERNRLAVMLSFLAGLRVGEIAVRRVAGDDGECVEGARAPMRHNQPPGYADGAGAPLRGQDFHRREIEVDIKRFGTHSVPYFRLQPHSAFRRAAFASAARIRVSRYLRSSPSCQGHPPP